MAAATVGLNLQASGASDGITDRFRFGLTQPGMAGTAGQMRFDPSALDLALEAVRTVRSGLVEDLKRELRREAASIDPPIEFRVTPPSLRVHDRLVQLPLDTPVLLRFGSQTFLIEAPDLKLHGEGETISDAIQEMSDHFEGLVDHYRSLRPEQLTPGGQRIRDTLLGVRGL